MVVLSAAIMASSGSKALVSRQFVEMSRMRVEGLLAAFPKLIGHSKQHTFVETDSVRYVYQPLENQMYILLITTKASNIVEDLGTLRLLAKVVPDVAGGLQESAINENAFELIFAFDEVLTTGGYKEDVTLSAIKTNLLMDSHEEQMHILIEEKKKEEAKKVMNEKANEMRKKAMENMKNNFMDGVGSGNGGATKQAPTGMQGFGGGGPPNSSFDKFGLGNSSTGYKDPYESVREERKVEEAPRIAAKTTFSLGKGIGNKKKDNLMAAMAAEDNFSFLEGKKSGGLGLSPVETAPSTPSTPLSLALEEKITVSMNREGGVEACDIKGTLSLTANTDAGSMATVAVNKSIITSKCRSNWTFATHPKINKPDYEKKGVLCLKGGKGLPLKRPVGVLRWSYSGDDAAPLTINCWPEDEGTGSINVNIEFELIRSDMTLNDVNILLPLGTTDPPVIESIDGQFKHDASSGMMCWHHDVVDSNNSSGSLEFSIAGSDVDVFFPIQIGFKSESFLCPIEVTEVVSSTDGSPIPNIMSKAVVPEGYQVA